MTTTLAQTNLPIATDHEAAEADIWWIKLLALLTELDSKVGVDPRTVTANTTLTQSDNGTFIWVNSSSDLTITLPQNSTEDLSTGFNCTIIRQGTGAVTLAKEGSDTLTSVSSYTKIANRYGAVQVAKKTDADWWAFGDLGA